MSSLTAFHGLEYIPLRSSGRVHIFREGQESKLWVGRRLSFKLVPIQLDSAPLFLPTFKDKTYVPPSQAPTLHHNSKASFQIFFALNTFQQSLQTTSFSPSYHVIIRILPSLLRNLNAYEEPNPLSPIPYSPSPRLLQRAHRI